MTNSDRLSARWFRRPGGSRGCEDHCGQRFSVRRHIDLLRVASAACRSAG